METEHIIRLWVHVSFPLKDDEINHQSQMVEKLKEQMLDQEEVKDLGFISFHQFG